MRASRSTGESRFRSGPTEGLQGPSGADVRALRPVSGPRSHKSTSRANSSAVVTLFYPVRALKFAIIQSVFADPEFLLVHQSGELEKLLMKEGLVSEFLPDEAPEPKSKA